MNRNGDNSPLWCTYVTTCNIRQGAPQTNKLRPVLTGEIKKHDSHSATSTIQVRVMQQVDDSNMHPHRRLIGKLKRVQRRFHLWSKLGHRTFLTCATGLKLMRPNGVAFFGSGTKQDVFQSTTTLSCIRRRLKMCCRMPVSWEAQDFRTLWLI